MKDDAHCQLGPVPGRHEVPDEYIDTEACANTEPHPDHYWSVKGHKHDGIGWVCDRYCEGVES